MIRKSLLLLISFYSIQGFCLTLSPIDIEIREDKPQGYYTLINDSNYPKMIGISAYARSSDIDGKILLEPTKDLIIYPKQVPLKAKEKRLVRVIWKSKEKLTSEKAYRIIFQEQSVDVDFGEDQLGEGEKRAGVSFGVRFDGSVYIQPTKAVSPNIEVTSYSRKQIDGEDYLVIMLENTGSKHKIIRTSDLELELLIKADKDQESWHLVSEEVLQNAAGGSIMLLSGGKRLINLPCKAKQIPENVLGVRIIE